MSATREEIAAIVVDVVAEHFERLRSTMLEQLLDMEIRMRRPDFALTKLGELYCDGKLIGDVRPVFAEVVRVVMDERLGKSDAR
jgi:hypothetical protein